ncbi:MAG: NAD(P)-binding domain-containing protein [Planctomycetota bacterium]
MNRSADTQHIGRPEAGNAPADRMGNDRTRDDHSAHPSEQHGMDDDRGLLGRALPIAKDVAGTVAKPVLSYTHWLHARWPAGKPEILPIVNEDNTTNIPGLFVVGDLSGIPLLKLSVNGGTRIARRVHAELQNAGPPADDVLDVAIIGGGTAGFSAALEAEKLGLKYLVFEASQPFNTIANFPKGKPIFKYPTDMPLDGDIEFHDKSDIKEGLIEDLEEQTVDLGLKYVLGKASHVERKGGLFEVVLPGGSEPADGVHLNGTGWALGEKRVKARRVIVGIGRSGNYRKLNVPGEDKAHKVYNRLHDPKDFCSQDVLIVGGGDSALEAAIALAKCGGSVTLSYRKDTFNRPKPENAEAIAALAADPDAEMELLAASDARQGAALPPEMPKSPSKGKLNLVMASNVKEIHEDTVDLKLKDGSVQSYKNDAVFTMIGREPPLDFFRKSGVKILGDRPTKWWITIVFAFLFCTWMYHWKGDKAIAGLADLPGWLVWDPRATLAWLLSVTWAPIADYFNQTNTLGYTLITSMGGKSFYYTLAYCSCVVIFGIRRIKRRRTPYVKVQTFTLMSIQCIPLFILPEIILPYMGRNGLFEIGTTGGWMADWFFEPYDATGQERAYWRAYGFILAWPLFVYNWFTDAPMWGWLILGFLQTFVAIPLLIRYFGKGSYCGWICSCGALAETLGDTHRHKMPHGPFWNRVNMIGQVFLWAAAALLLLRIVAWSVPDGSAVDRPLENFFSIGFQGMTKTWNGYGYEMAKVDGVLTPFAILNYGWFVDLLFAGILGVAFYFHFSGRVWCRFACPLAALMHIYARFSKFGIVANKKKCISCNVCTSVCHQGIDIMSFANKGMPMKDPECVRCSACVQMCPTGVLTFGQTDRDGNTVSVDPSWLAASPVQMAESQLTINGETFKR